MSIYNQNLFIQSNDKNKWHKAYPWQNIFLKEDSVKLYKTMYHHNENHVYVNIPISLGKNIPCENIKNVAMNSGIFDIDNFKNKNWILQKLGWYSFVNDISSSGFLCNLTTGTSLMYVITHNKKELDLKHDGSTILSSKSLDFYRKKYEEIMFN